MYKAAVIGAGYMGSAITFPLSANNIEVNLVGTWLDEDLIASSLAGYHPKLKKPLPGLVKPIYWQDMASAVEDVDIIFIAVTSEGFVNVFSQVLDAIDKNYYFFKLTKGLVEYKGSVVRATQAAHDMFKLKFPTLDFMWASVGGPVKAVELSDKIITASIYALNSKNLKDLAYGFSTDYYTITITDDIIGVEVSSTFKNVYSVVIGICDGLFKSTKEGMYHNFNAFLFSQAMIEMSKIAEKAGGRKETVFDLAGIGDFYVASMSGRNRRYGEYVGSGENPQKIFEKMFDEGEVAEGYLALKIGIEWVKSLGNNLINETPLLSSLYKIIFNDHDPIQELKNFTKEMSNRYRKLNIKI